MKRYFIGIDIGGSKIRAGLIRNKKVLRTIKIKTPRGKNDFIPALKNLIGKLGGGKKIARVGIAAAGIIKGGMIIKSPNIPYLNKFPLVKNLGTISPASLVNDARAFARGESGSPRYSASGAGRTKKLFAVTLGTGIGRAFAERGEAKKIKRFEYPERWEKDYQKIWDKAHLAKFLGLHLAKLIKPYRPTTVVLGGGVAHYPEFFKKLNSELHARGLDSRIVLSKSDDKAILIGAVYPHT